MKNLSVILLIGLLGCRPAYRAEDIVGLWQLEMVQMDAVDQGFNPTFLEIRPNRSFAVSQVSGDLAGVYRFDSNKLSLYSTDDNWFTNAWSVFLHENQLDLRGKDFMGRNMRFRYLRIEQVPDFEEFEAGVVGRWQLYKIRKDGKVTDRLADTWFSIDEQGNYAISKGDTIIESGPAAINTRHHRIIFEDDQTEWRAWHYGSELRLTNRRSGVEYSLRKR